MSTYTLERKLAAPVACTSCAWSGQAADLLTRREADGSPFRCPACKGGWCIIWIEAPSTNRPECSGDLAREAPESYLASLQSMADDVLAYSDDAEVRITVGDVRRMQGDPSSATLLALLAAESDLRNWPDDLPSMGAVRDAIAKLVAGSDAEGRAYYYDCPCGRGMRPCPGADGKPLCFNAAPPKPAPDATSPIGQADVEALRHLANSMGFGRTHDMLRRVIAATPYLSAPVPSPDGVGEPWNRTYAFADLNDAAHARPPSATGAAEHKIVDALKRPNREETILSRPEIGAAEQDAVRDALKDAEKFIANFVGEPNASGINPTICLAKIRNVLSTPTPGLTIAQMERATKACRDNKPDHEFVSVCNGDLRKLDEATHLIAESSPQDVGREATIEPTQAQVSSACMSFRHDYGLLDGATRDGLKREAREWLRAWQKEGFGRAARAFQGEK